MSNEINFKDIPIYAIVVEQSPISLWYFEKILPSWQAHGYQPILFPACTPETITQRTELKFSDYVNTGKYISRKIKKPFSPTEKACWYSHYSAWQKCIEQNRPIAVIEHDAMLINIANLKVRADLSFFDASAMGGYVINPKAARKLVKYLAMVTIPVTPYSMIRMLKTNNNKHDKLAEFKRNFDYSMFVLEDGPIKEFATKQLFNHALDRTIHDRYDTLDPTLAAFFESSARESEHMIHIYEDTTQWMLARGYPPIQSKYSTPLQKKGVDL